MTTVRPAVTKNNIAPIVRPLATWKIQNLTGWPPLDRRRADAGQSSSSRFQLLRGPELVDLFQHVDDLLGDTVTGLNDPGHVDIANHLSVLVE